MVQVVPSDHAVLRYMERRHGIDVDAYRQALMREFGPLLECGAKAAKVDGLKAVVREGVICTVHAVSNPLPRSVTRHKRQSRGARS